MLHNIFIMLLSKNYKMLRLKVIRRNQEIKLRFRSIRNLQFKINISLSIVDKF